MLIKSFADYCTLFLSCINCSSKENIGLYKKLTTKLLNTSTSSTILSVFIDAKPSTSFSFIKNALYFIKSLNLVENAEISLSVPLSSHYLISKLIDLNQFGVNRICFQPITFRPNLTSQGNSALNLVKYSSQFCEKVSVDVLFDCHCKLTYNDCWNFFVKLIAVGVTHITLQQSESNSSFTNGLSEQFLFFKQYSIAREVLLNLGFFQYELCYFALPGFRSVHYLSLWQGRSFIGVGPNAHSRIFTQNKRLIKRSAIVCTYKNANFSITTKRLTDLECMEELLFLGLRSVDGVNNDLWQTFSGGKSLSDVFKNNFNFLQLCKENIIILSKDCLKLNMAKILVLDSVLKILFAILYELFT